MSIFPDLLFWYAIALLIGAPLFWSIRQLASGNTNLRNNVVMVLSAAILVTFVSTQYFAYSSMAQLIAIADASNQQLVDLPEDWGSGLDLEARQSKSRQRAANVFLSTGQRHHYVNSAGGREIFSPSPAEIVQREQETGTAARFRTLTDQIGQLIVWWAICGVGATALGWAVGRRRSNKNCCDQQTAGATNQT